MKNNYLKIRKGGVPIRLYYADRVVDFCHNQNKKCMWNGAERCVKRESILKGICDIRIGESILPLSFV